MRGWRKLAGLASALVVALGANSTAVGTGPPAYPSGGQSWQGKHQRQPDRVVTLVTGDRVRLIGGDIGQPQIEPAPGRERVQFGIRTIKDELHVVPSDVQPRLMSGRLDRRLFNVSGLIKAGYDDSRSRSIPLIVTYDGVAGRASVKRSGAATVRDLPSINGTAVRLGKGRSLIGAPGVERVWLDGKRQMTLDQSVPQIGAPEAWRGGYTGKGVTVAVLDSGIDTSHPDFAGRIVAAKNFSYSPDGDAAGHGTHVASTIAGTGAASDARYRGVAPDTGLLIGKVCEDSGFCLDSAILAGMQWAAVEQRADVINLSLGSADTPEIDPLEEAVNTLTAQTGSLFVIAAGNSGPGDGTVGSPGSADAALTVGAVDKQDRIADFSSRGPRLGDDGVKPDVTAPGVDIVAAKAKDGYLGEPVGEHYARLSGTSMATPHVAGAAALLAQRRPDWTAPELKATLMSTARVQAGQTVFDQGAGRIDVARAIEQPVTVQPGSLSFGVASWPHDDDEPVARQLVYRNHGPVDVHLAIQATFTGPGGNPAPGGALTLSDSTVDVPAGGSATVTVTSDTRHDGVDGTYAGRVIATADGMSLVTPISGTKEVAQYELTVTHLDVNGKPTSEGGSTLVDFDTLETTFVNDESGTAKVRLPTGDYAFEGSIWDGEVTHHLVQPVLRLDKNIAITVDARRTKPVSITAPRDDARLTGFWIGIDIDTGGRAISFGQAGSPERTRVAPLGADAAPEQATAYVLTSWGVPDANGSFRNTPVTYSQMNTRHGGYFSGFTRAIKHSEMARIVATHNQQIGDRPTEKFASAIAPGMLEPRGFDLYSYDLPSTVTHFVEAGAVRWLFSYHEVVDDGGEGLKVTALWSEPRSYRPGRTYADRWNAAVFGPAFPRDGDAFRVGNRIIVDPPMYSDQDGHAGFSRLDTASVKLYRDGELLGESNSIVSLAFGVDNVPADRGDFRLTVAATRPGISGFSTSTDVEWRFSSQTASERGELLPLWAVRYFPTVDSHNTSKRHQVTVLPVKLETQPGARRGSLTTMKIQISGDDGTTWKDAAIRRTGDNRYVAVFATPLGDYVSLKAKAADSDGNSTEQVIVRAYALR